MKLLLMLLLLFISEVSLSQTSQKLKRKKPDDVLIRIEKINQLQFEYGLLNPFESEFNDYDSIESLQHQIIDELLLLFNDQRVRNYPVDSLIKGEEIFISTSPDKRIWFLSLDEKTGGSFKSNITLIHYRTLDGRVVAEKFSGELPYSGEDDFANNNKTHESTFRIDGAASAIYSNIVLVDSTHHLYYVQGNVRTCNTCRYDVAFSIDLDSIGIHPTFIAEYDGRDYGLLAFDYYPVEQELLVEYYEDIDNSAPLFESIDESEALYLKRLFRYKYLSGKFYQIEIADCWVKKIR
jgi:hypothetical protein